MWSFACMASTIHILSTGSVQLFTRGHPSFSLFWIKTCGSLPSQELPVLTLSLSTCQGAARSMPALIQFMAISHSLPWAVTQPAEWLSRYVHSRPECSKRAGYPAATTIPTSQASTYCLSPAGGAVTLKSALCKYLFTVIYVVYD